MLLNFNKITLHNFASYSHAEIELNNRGFCFVSGQNNCAIDNSDSNGSGKSFIWSGICFTLTGETIGGLQKGLKNLFVDEDLSYTRLEFTVDKDLYEITRYIAPKSDLHIIKNGIDVSGKGILESKKKLGELLPDLSKDLIASTFIIGQGMPSAFSKFSPSGRKELLEKLTKTDFMIEETKNRITTCLQARTNKLREHDDCLLIANTKLTSARSSLKLETDKLALMVKPDFNLERTKLTEQLTSITAESDSNTSLIMTKKQELVGVDSVLTTLNTAKSDEISAINAKFASDVEGGYSKKAMLSSNYATISAEIKTINTEIAKINSITEFCPTCKQRLIGVEKPSTAPLLESLGTKNAELEAVKADIISLDGKLAVATAQRDAVLADINSEYTTKASTNAMLKQQLTNEIDTIQRKLTTNITELATIRSNLARLDTEEASWDDKYNTVKTNIATYSNTISTLEAEIAKYTDEKADTEAHIAVLKRIDTLSKRDLRGRLLANIITYIDKKAKDFSETVFGTRDLKVYLDGNALDITYHDKLFDSLSGGEKMRVDLILQLAIRNMLQASFGTHANILVLDEITDFLDKKACNAVMKLVESELNTVESVFIISHRAGDLALPIDTELKIVKNADGISTVV